MADPDETNPVDQARIIAANARYMAALHAVQSGIVAYGNLWKPRPDKSRHPDSPPDLRVGIVSSQVTDLGLALLLIRKGMISWAEYHEAVADAAEQERERWTQLLSDAIGKPVGLA